MKNSGCNNSLIYRQFQHFHQKKKKNRKSAFVLTHHFRPVLKRILGKYYLNYCVNTSLKRISCIKYLIGML